MLVCFFLCRWQISIWKIFLFVDSLREIFPWESCPLGTGLRNPSGDLICCVCCCSISLFSLALCSSSFALLLHLCSDTMWEIENLIPYYNNWLSFSYLLITEQIIHYFLQQISKLIHCNLPLIKLYAETRHWAGKKIQHNDIIIFGQMSLEKPNAGKPVQQHWRFLLSSSSNFWIQPLDAFSTI